MRGRENTMAISIYKRLFSKKQFTKVILNNIYGKFIVVKVPRAILYPVELPTDMDFNEDNY